MATSKKDILSALELVKSRYNSAKKYRAPLEIRWNRYYKNWRNYLKKSRDKYRANLFIPYSFQVVETIVPRLLSHRPQLKTAPREPQDVEGAEIMEEVLDYQWDRADGDYKLEIFVRAGLIYGTSFLKVGVQESGEEPTLENIDIFDFFIDPDATSLEDAQFAIYRTRKTIDELKQNPNYKNIGLLKNIQSDDRDEYKAERRSVLGLGAPETDSGSKKIEVLEYWEDNRLIVVAGQKVVLRDEENPYPHKKKPFVVFRDYYVPNEFYGIGELEHIEKLQEEGNTLRNQITDNANLINNKMWKIRRSGQINPRSVVSRPGGMILVNESDDIQPLETTPLGSQVFDLESVIKGDIQQTTGVTDYQTGPGTQGTSLNKTARGISLIQEAGNYRFRLKVRHLEQSIKHLGTFLIANNQGFIQKPFVIRVVGRQGYDFKKINPEDIQGSFDIIPEMGADEPVDKNVQREKFLQLVAILSQPQFAQSVNWQEVARMILEKFDINNADEILMGQQGEVGGDKISQFLQNKSPEEIQQFLAQLDPQNRQIMVNAIQEKLNQTNGQA